MRIRRNAGTGQAAVFGGSLFRHAELVFSDAAQRAFPFFGKIFKRRAGNQISFHGTIGTQTVMPHGTPEEVKQAVWKNLDIAGAAGGLFVAPTHMVEPEVPLENILAYVEACRIYRKA